MNFMQEKYFKCGFVVINLSLADDDRLFVQPLGLGSQGPYDRQRTKGRCVDYQCEVEQYWCYHQ
jgi:hypothetical protein